MRDGVGCERPALSVWPFPSVGVREGWSAAGLGDGVGAVSSSPLPTGCWECVSVQHGNLVLLPLQPEGGRVAAAWAVPRRVLVLAAVALLCPWGCCAGCQRCGQR